MRKILILSLLLSSCAETPVSPPPALPLTSFASAEPELVFLAARRSLVRSGYTIESQDMNGGFLLASQSWEIPADEVERALELTSGVLELTGSLLGLAGTLAGEKMPEMRHSPDLPPAREWRRASVVIEKGEAGGAQLDLSMEAKSSGQDHWHRRESAETWRLLDEIKAEVARDQLLAAANKKGLEESAFQALSAETGIKN